MSPLIAFAVSLLPALAKRLVDNVIPDVEGKIADKIKNVVGTTDADQVAQKAQDPKVAAQLRVQLAQIAAEGDQREQALQAQKLQSQFDSFKAELQDTEGARTMLTDLAEQKSVIAWGPVIVSTVVVIGFFVVLSLLLLDRTIADQGNQLVMQIVNIAVGALTAGFATVVSFWLGSSQGSRNKDAHALQAQAMATTAQRESLRTTRDMFTAQSNQTAALIDHVGRAPVASPTTAATLAPVSSSTTAAVAPASTAVEGTQEFQKCMDVVLREEGGYVDNPDDPGGATNFGITQKTLAAWRKVESVTPDEVKALTRAEAEEIYRAQYWNALNCDQLPKGVDLVTFDFGVNAGVSRAARTLQQAVHVGVDGQVGPITVHAARQANPEALINQISDLRLEFYKGLSDFGTFGEGWTRRVAAVREAALALAKGQDPTA